MSLEVVVRPIVVPDIRPPAARRIAPPDDPTKGLAAFGGGGGTFIGTSLSSSVNMSHQKPHQETKRQVDVERVYQQDDQGNVNKDNFIDVERMKKVRAEAKDGGAYSTLRTIYADPSEQRPNVETLESDKTIDAAGP